MRRNTVRHANRRGFTLVEIIITVVLLAIIMIPIGLMISEYIRNAAYGSMIVRTMGMANRELAIMRVSPNPLSEGSVTYPNYELSGFGLKRRIGAQVPTSGGDPRLNPAEVSLCPAGGEFDTGRILTIPTYVISDTNVFGVGSSGENRRIATGQTDSNHFSSSGGGLRHADPNTFVEGVTISNSRACNLMINKISLRSKRPMNLYKVAIEDKTIFDGVLNLPGGSPPANPTQYGAWRDLNLRPYFYMAGKSSYLVFYTFNLQSTFTPDIQIYYSLGVAGSGSTNSSSYTYRTLLSARSVITNGGVNTTLSPWAVWVVAQNITADTKVILYDDYGKDRWGPEITPAIAPDNTWLSFQLPANKMPSGCNWKQTPDSGIPRIGVRLKKAGDGAVSDMRLIDTPFVE